MALINLYLRREPTTDAILIERRATLPTAARFDVVAYRDRACTERAARWTWFTRYRPTRAWKRVMVNCWTYRVVWLAPVKDGAR